MSNILQKDIPRVKELCDSLGFRMGSDRPHFQLVDHTHKWRREFVTDDGIPGTELKEWRNPKHQDGLECMTEAFLESRGEALWPEMSGFLEYPSEKPLITALVKQLFWRQNTNEARNAGFYQAREHADHQGDASIRPARSKESPNPNSETSKSTRLPPASQLSNFKATLASAPSRNPQNVLGRPDTSDERRLNPSIKEQNLDTIFAERPVAIARSKRSHVEDRRDNSELAFELKDSTLSRGEDDAFHILTDDDDNTPLWGPPEKTVTATAPMIPQQKPSTKRSNKVTTPRKEKPLPGSVPDRYSDDNKPRENKRAKLSDQRTHVHKKKKTARPSKSSPRTSSSDQEKRATRPRMKNKDGISSESGVSSMRKTSSGVEAQDHSQGRNYVLARLPIDLDEMEFAQIVNPRPENDVSTQRTTQGNEAHDKRPTDLPDGRLNTSLEAGTSARTTTPSDRALDDRPQTLPPSTGEKANTNLLPTFDGSPKRPHLDDIVPSGSDAQKNTHPSNVEISMPPNILSSSTSAEMSKPPDQFSSTGNADRQVLTQAPDHHVQEELPVNPGNSSSAVKRENPPQSPSHHQPGSDSGEQPGKASSNTSTSASSSGVNIRFTIIKARHPRLQLVRWSNGSLSAHNNVTSLFREISRLTARPLPQIAYITFKLMTSNADIEFRIRAKDDEAEFRAMQSEFLMYIKDDRKKTKNREFAVELELDPLHDDDDGKNEGGSGAEEKDEEEGVGQEEDDDDDVIML